MANFHVRINGPFPKSMLLSLSLPLLFFWRTLLGSEGEDDEMSEISIIWKKRGGGRKYFLVDFFGERSESNK